MYRTNSQPLTDEVLYRASAIRDDGARLYIAADCFWGDQREQAFFYIWIVNRIATSKSFSH